MSRGTLDTAMSCWILLTGLSPSLASFPKTVLLSSMNQLCGPNPRVHAPWFGLFRFRSPLLPESHVVFSSSGYLDVSVHRKLIAAYHVFHRLLVPRHPPCALSSLTRCLFAAGTALKRRCIALHPWLFVYIFRFAYLSICLGCLVS